MLDMESSVRPRDRAFFFPDSFSGTPPGPGRLRTRPLLNQVPRSLATRLRSRSSASVCYLPAAAVPPASLAICSVFRHFQPKVPGRKMQIAENKALPKKLTPGGAPPASPPHGYLAICRLPPATCRPPAPLAICFGSYHFQPKAFDGKAQIAENKPFPKRLTPGVVHPQALTSPTSYVLTC
jgi:hypothetical protein